MKKYIFLLFFVILCVNCGPSSSEIEARKIAAELEKKAAELEKATVESKKRIEQLESYLLVAVISGIVLFVFGAVVGSKDGKRQHTIAKVVGGVLISLLGYVLNENIGAVIGATIGCFVSWES